MSEIIKELKNEAAHMVDSVRKERGNQVTFEITDMDYDKPHSSYVISVNAFGTELEIVYVFEEEVIHVWDVTNQVTVMSHEADSYLGDFFVELKWFCYKEYCKEV